MVLLQTEHCSGPGLTQMSPLKNKTFQVEGPVGVDVITDSTRKVAIATSDEHKMADLSPVAKMVK